MPAAASFEDLYPQATCAGSLSTSYHHLPDYMNMFLSSDSTKQPQQQRHHHHHHHQRPAGSVAAELPPPKSDKDQQHAHQNQQQSQQQQQQNNQTNIKSTIESARSSCHTNSSTSTTSDNHTNNKQQRLINRQQQQQQELAAKITQAAQASTSASSSSPPPSASSAYHSRSHCHPQSNRDLHEKQHYIECDKYNPLQYYYDDDDDLFIWRPHSYSDYYDGSHSSSEHTRLNLENIMIMHDDFSGSPSSQPPIPHLLDMTPPITQQHYLTLEELKSARNSCWLCGCNWQQDHVSLDCPECDGYALTRPCPNCDGKCKQVWMRNISGTHDRHKASWIGQCKFGTNGNAKTTDCQQQQTTSGVTGGPMQKLDATTKTTMTKRQQGQDLARTQDSTGGHMATSTSATTTTVKSLHLPTASSCCSSQPSSAASSDSE